jgi:hypothetical protein
MPRLMALITPDSKLKRLQTAHRQFARQRRWIAKCRRAAERDCHPQKIAR